MNWLEVVLNPRLHGSIADLCGDRTEVSGVRVVDVVADGGVIEPRVIQHVEGDPAKLQVPGSAERNALPKGQVEIPETGQPQRVLRLIPEGPRSGVSKRAFVEPDGPRTIELGPAAVRIANDVEELLAAARADAGEIAEAPHIKGDSGLRLENPGEVPAAKYGPQRRGRRLEPRKPVRELAHEDVRPVEVGDAVVATVVIRVRQDIPTAVPIVLRPRQRVRDAEPDIAAERSFVDLD